VAALDRNTLWQESRINKASKSRRR